MNLLIQIKIWRFKKKFLFQKIYKNLVYRIYCSPPFLIKLKGLTKL